MNTRNFFNKSRTIFHQNQLGGTIGGPIRKDRTFFFFSYQGTFNRVPQAGGVTTVFTDAQRGGAFGGLSTSKGTSPVPLIGDDGKTYPAGTPYKTIFSAGTIPTADFSPIAAGLMSSFVPHGNSGPSTFSFSPLTTGHAHQFVYRVDHTISSKDTIWFYMFQQTNPTQDTLPFTGANLPGFAEVAQRHIKNLTLAWNHTLSGTTLNEARIGYNRFNFVTVKPVTSVLPSSAGFTGITPQDPVNAGLPTVVVTGLFTLGFSDNGPQPRIDQVRQFTDNFTMVKGNHTLKMGFEYRGGAVYNPFAARNNGHFDFAGTGEFTTGVAGADFLLGIPDDYTQGSGDIIDARTREYYTYFQDQYKVRPTLTLTLGTGYQIDTPIADIYHAHKAIICWRPGEQSKVFPTAPLGIVYPGDPNCTESGYSTHYGHFGPRFGFAYSPNSSNRLFGGQGKTSIRGGFGVYFNRTEEEVTLQNLEDPPYGVTSSGAADTGIGSPSFANPFADINGRPGGSIGNKFPFSNPAPGAAIDFSQFEPFSINVIDPNFAVPYAMNYNLTIERNLGPATVLSVAYVGSQGRKLHTAYDLNYIANPAACAANPKCVSKRSSLATSFPNLLRYPGFSNGLGQESTFVNSGYNSLQIYVDRKLYHGLQFLASYSYAHSIDEGSGFEDGAFGGSTHGLNPFNLLGNRGDSQFDARHRFVASYAYDIPSVRHFNAFEKIPSRLTDGWRLTGITTYQTGFPITTRDTALRSLSCATPVDFYACPDTPDLIGPIQSADVRTSNFTFTSTGLAPVARDHYAINPNAFAHSAFGTFGNAGRNFFHGPGIANMDFGLYKDTRVTESTRVEMRFEFFNIFNHAQFGPDRSVTGNVNSSSFGRLLTAFTGTNGLGDSRVVQLAAKFYF
jgi:hypothetical protein